MENNKILQLRFPEFTDEWIEKKVGEVFYVNAGGDVAKKHVSKEKTKVFQYPIYANASENKGFYAYSDIYKIEPPVITVAGRGVYIGIAHARNHKFYPIVRLLVLKPKEEQNIYFFENRINKINLFVESTGVPQLTAPQISSYRIRFPKIEEQTKIATFLIAIEKRINLLQKKKSELEQYKKGVMQKLFTSPLTGRDAAGRGGLRFKDDDGNDFPDWEEKKLGEVCTTIKSGKTKPKENGVFPVYGSTGIIGQCSEYLHDGIVLLVARVGANAGMLNIAKGKFGVTDNTLILELSSSVVLGFLFSCLIKFDLKRLIFGSGQPLITGGQLKSIKIYLPSLPEQQKIANFLSSIDKSIENISNQIDDSVLFKQGLLQKMFV